MEITATLESEIWQSENSSDCRVITEVAPPYRVVHANLPWCHTTGWAQSEICNNTCQVLQGPDTCRLTLQVRRSRRLPSPSPRLRPAPRWRTRVRAPQSSRAARRRTA